MSLLHRRWDATGALVLVALGAWAAWSGRSSPKRYVAASLAMLVPYVVALASLTESLLPGTLSAKVAQGESGFWLPEQRFLQRWLSWFSAADPGIYVGVSLVLASVGVLVLVRGPLRRWLAALGTSGLLFIVAYGIVLDVPAYPWYYAFPWFLVTVFAAAGMGRLAAWRSRASLIVVVALAAVLCLVGWSGIRSGQKPTYHAYWEIGEWLRGNTSLDASVAASEIGIIGWASDREMIDYLGLLDPQSAEELGKGDVTSWISRRTPDYWVRFEPPIRVERPVTNQPWFPYAYRPTHVSGAT